MLVRAEPLEISEIEAERLDGGGRSLAVLVLGKQRLAELVAGAGDIVQAGVAVFGHLPQGAQRFDRNAGLETQRIEPGLALYRA